MQVEIDPRLLIFLPHYKALFSRNNPTMKITDEIAKEAMLHALRASGAVKMPGGVLRLEPTAEFLESSGQA